MGILFIHIKSYINESTCLHYIFILKYKKKQIIHHTTTSSSSFQAHSHHLAAHLHNIHMQNIKRIKSVKHPLSSSHIQHT